MWTFCPLFILVLIAWVIFCIFQIKRAYHVWKYQVRNQYKSSDVDLTNSRNKLIRNILLLMIVLVELANIVDCFITQSSFARKWKSNNTTFTLNQNCTLDKQTWLNDFYSVSYSNWFLEGFRQFSIIVDLNIYRLVILHLEQIYLKRRETIKKLIFKIIPGLTIANIVLVLCSYERTYILGFGISVIFMQILLVQLCRDYSRLYKSVFWYANDLKHEMSLRNPAPQRLETKLKQSKRAILSIYVGFQFYVFTLILYLLVVLVLETFFLNPCWIQSEFKVDIPTLPINKHIFYTISYSVWILRTIAASTLSSSIMLLSLCYFSRVIWKRICLEIRFYNLCPICFKRNVKQRLLV